MKICDENKTGMDGKFI